MVNKGLKVAVLEANRVLNGTTGHTQENGWWEIMKLLDWVFTRRRGIKATFDKFPNSLVILRLINHYYFVYYVDWSKTDQIVTRVDFEEMGLLINRELGMEKRYLERKSIDKSYWVK